MDRSIGSPRTRSVVGVRGPGVSVFGLPLACTLQVLLDLRGVFFFFNELITSFVSINSWSSLLDEVTE